MTVAHRLSLSYDTRSR